MTIFFILGHISSRGPSAPPSLVAGLGAWWLSYDPCLLVALLIIVVFLSVAGPDPGQLFSLLLPLSAFVIQVFIRCCSELCCLFEILNIISRY